MSQIENGIRRILNHAFFYNLFQWSVGATKARKDLIENFAHLKPGMKVLDIGCGPGTIIKFLPTFVSYVGIDSNQKYIEFASKKFGDNYNFIHENANNISILKKFPKFDLILALGLIHHLSDDESSKLFEFAANTLSSDGRLITLDGCYIENQSRVSKYFLDKDRGQNVRKESEYRALAQKHFTNIKTTISEEMLRIPYTLLIMECSL